jgi:DNA gyrase subunit A
VKRTSLDQYSNARVGGIEAIKLTAKDQVLDVRVTDGEGEVVLVSRGGRAIRFPEAEVPLMGRAAQGVRGIKLKPGERVAGMAVPRREGGELVLVTERGWVRRLSLDELQPQGRGGLGTVLLSPAKDTGDVAAAREVHPGEDLMAVTSGGRAVRVKLDAVPKAGRAGAAEKSVSITGNERIAEVTHVAERELPESPEDEPAFASPVSGDEDGGVEIEDAVAPPPSSNGSAPPDATAEPEPDPPARAAEDGELDLFA